MAQKTKLGSILINEGKEVLIREVLRMLPYTTVTLLGAAGTGKTTILEELATKAGFIDELAILRLQGLSSEDFKMPILVNEKKKVEVPVTVEEVALTHFKQPETEKVVEFTKMGILKKICDNPNTNYLVFLDEILRTDASVAPLLFELLERKIDGIFRPNMFVVTAANYDENQFIQNFDYKDPALRRRQVFIEYVPNKEDIENYMMKNDYHPIIRELVELLPLSSLIDESYVLELEQTTQLGSWALLNNRWKDMEKEGINMNSYKNCQEDLIIYGNYMFNNKTISELGSRLALLEEMNTLDIQKEIIENNGLNTPGYVMHNKKGAVYDFSDKKPQLLIRTKYFIKNKIVSDMKYAETYGVQIAKVFTGKPELLATLFQDVNASIEKKYKNKFPEDLTKASNKAENDKLKFAHIMYNALTSVQSKDKDVEKILQEFSEALQISNAI